MIVSSMYLFSRCPGLKNILGCPGLKKYMYLRLPWTEKISCVHDHWPTSRTISLAYIILSNPIGFAQQAELFGPVRSLLAARVEQKFEHLDKNSCTPYWLNDWSLFLSLKLSMLTPPIYSRGIRFAWEIYYLIREITGSVNKTTPNLLFFFWWVSIFATAYGLLHFLSNPLGFWFNARS
jgi:hypothetical protein